MPTVYADPRIRPAREADVPAVVQLVHDLAEYQSLPDKCEMTAPPLRDALFGPAPALFCHVAEVDGEVVGCALWFVNFSTWRNQHGLYLEDLFVQPAHRGAGLGKALLATLAAECVRRGYRRLEWNVLDWNTPSIEFYRSLGAVPLEGVTVFRLADEALTRLGRVS